MSTSPSLHEIICLVFTEVVICTLISSFSFKESNKPIKWDMGTIVSPRVESEKDHTLPLIVTSLTWFLYRCIFVEMTNFILGMGSSYLTIFYWSLQSSSSSVNLWLNPSDIAVVTATLLLNLGVSSCQIPRSNLSWWLMGNKFILLLTFPSIQWSYSLRQCRSKTVGVSIIGICLSIAPSKWE